MTPRQERDSQQLKVKMETSPVAAKTAADGISSFIRPTSFEEVVGLHTVKRIVTNEIEGSKLLGEPPPHFYISGPPGLGKTTVGGVIATKLGGNVYHYMGSDLKKEEDVHNIAAHTKDNDVVIVEEAHSLANKVQTAMLIWMEDYRLYGGGGVGVAPKCCFVFPTTSGGKLTKAFRTRCKALHVSYYKIDEMKEVLKRAGHKMGMDLTSDDEALTMLAKSSRATPRIAVMHRLDPLRKIMAVEKLEYNKDTVFKVFEAYDINEWGLEANDINYCNILYDKLIAGKGRPVSKKIIMQTSGLAEDIVDEIIEPYLQQINAIQIGHGGRTLTSMGYEIIDREPVMATSTAALTDPTMNGSINLDELKNLVESSPHIRKGGMKALAPILGLRYGPDNGIIKECLERVGYTAKRKAGIVKL